MTASWRRFACRPTTWRRAPAQVAAALPGSELARVAGTEAAEWSREMTDVAAVFERYTALLEVAVAAMGRADTAGAAALRR